MLEDVRRYKKMLKHVRNKMKAIEQVSLEEDSYNKEWLELNKMEDSLIKVTKIIKKRDNGFIY